MKRGSESKRVESALAPSGRSDRSAFALAEAQASLRALRRRFAPLAAGAAMGVIAPTVALAAPGDPLQGVTLKYEAPMGCSSERDVLAKLREALGANPEPLPEVLATIVVSGDTPRFVLRYRAQRGKFESRRTLVLDSCEAATEASALLLLLTLDPVLAESLGVSRVVAESETPETSPEPRAEVTPSAPDEPSAKRRKAPPKLTVMESVPTPAPDAEERPWVDGGWLALGGSFLSAITPGPGLGVALEGGLRRAPFRLGVGGGWVRSPNVAAEEVPGATLSASVLRANLTAALEFGSEVLRFGPATSLGINRLEIKPRRVSGGRAGSTPVLSTSAGAWATFGISGDWGLLARASALVPLERPRFWVRGLHEPVHRPAAVGADAFLGLFWAWGSRS